jgi:adenylate cyclase
MIAGDLQTARNMRLRLRFHERELVLEERHLSLTVGRSADNDLVMKGHLISRLHARIEIRRNEFVRHDSLPLKGQGLIGLGRLPEQGSPHTIGFTWEEL